MLDAITKQLYEEAAGFLPVVSLKGAQHRPIFFCPAKGNAVVYTILPS